MVILIQAEEKRPPKGNFFIGSCTDCTHREHGAESSEIAREKELEKQRNGGGSENGGSESESSENGGGSENDGSESGKSEHGEKSGGFLSSLFG
uniref:Uncharacterized protein n=1 Tax=Acrobeloides nanus TaxID=290746 RepID=A0A914CQD5_9BILA